MLATGRYAQWQSRFLRYVDTKPNKQELRQCIFDGPYVMTEITVLAKPTTAIEEAVPEHTIVETYKTTTPEKLDACTTAKEMWISIKRLHQGESLNKQDVKTSLFWEFGKFTSRDGESIESYYSRFYKMMNEMVRNKLEVSTMQYHNKVNEIRAKKLSRNANPLALVAVAQLSRYILSSTKISQIICTTSKTVIFNQISCYYQVQKQRDSQTNRLREIGTGHFMNQRTVAGARKTIGNQVVQQTGIQCFNCKEFGHFAKECKKPKWAKDYAYHKEKMLLCKQAKKGVPLRADNVIPNSSDICDNDDQADQNAEEYEDKRVVFANLIANLKLDHDENKKILKQLNKENASLTHELNECKSALEESNDI
ncbi:gag-pol polyprotein [Tanacetum coccineum]|uniref:Gag-pol polyprotein n=1 Tax=Tanacetum coccineum TaxID=301880 RepID=A0ABQ4YK51_9ASTR